MKTRNREENGIKRILPIRDGFLFLELGYFVCLPTLKFLSFLQDTMVHDFIIDLAKLVLPQHLLTLFAMQLNRMLSHERTF